MPSTSRNAQRSGVSLLTSTLCVPVGSDGEGHGVFSVSTNGDWRHDSPALSLLDIFSTRACATSRSVSGRQLDATHKNTDAIRPEAWRRIYCSMVSVDTLVSVDDPQKHCEPQERVRTAVIGASAILAREFYLRITTSRCKANRIPICPVVRLRSPCCKPQPRRRDASGCYAYSLRHWHRWRRYGDSRPIDSTRR
jgi:hypothetical protein